MSAGRSRESRIEPMLARDAKVLPEGEEWAYEIKWDGVRAFAVTDGEGGSRIQARRGEDLTARYPELTTTGSGSTALAEATGGRAAVLDGEIVAFDEAGKPSFQLLQRRMGVTSPLTIQRRAPEVPVSFIAFDLLGLDGRDTTSLPYEERRELLADLITEGERIKAPRHHVGDGGALLEAARLQGLEGVVAKRRESAYRPGSRTGDWVKVRLKHRQDFVIGGWLRGQGGRSGRLGSLLLGVWDVGPGEAAERGEAQKLVFAGGVGSGLSEWTIDQLSEMLAPLAQEENPFELGVGPKRADSLFVEPRLVCSVEFSEWTYEDTLRQPAYKGLRDDVEPQTVLGE